MIRMTHINICLILLLSFSLSGCGGEQKPSIQDQKHTGEDTSVPVYGDAFIESSIADAVILNPLLSSDTSSSDVWGMIFDGLVRYTPDYELEGKLAESFEILHNKSVYYVHIESDENSEVPFDANKLRSELINLSKSGADPWTDIEDITPLPDFDSEDYNCLRINWKGEHTNTAELINNKLIEIIPETTTVKVNDQVIINFKLRDGIKWHDGVDFTADDVVFTWQKIMDPSLMITGRAYFTLIDSVEKITPHQVRVTYKEHFAPAVASWTRSILPKHLLQDQDLKTAEFNRAPVGTGPYRFVEWRPDERIVLEANEDYFEGKPYISRYIFLIVPDKSIQMVKLMSQEIDFMSLTPDQFDKTASTEEFKSRFHRFNYQANRSYTYVGYNHDSPLFNDKMVRRAMTHAIDRNLLIKSVLRGYGHIVSGSFPKASWACDPEIKPWPYDPSKAKELLDNAGWKDTDGDGIRDKIINGEKTPFSFRLTTNNGHETRLLTSRLISQQLSEVGVEAKVELMEWGRFMDELDYRDFEAIVLGWSLGMDPDQHGIWHSSQVPDKKQNKPGNNFINFAKPEIDELIESGRTTLNREKRTQIYRKLHSILHDEQPYTFLYAPNSLVAIHNRFHGIKVEPIGLWYHFNKWFVPLTMQRYK